MGPTGFEPATPWLLQSLVLDLTHKSQVLYQAELRSLIFEDINKFIKFLINIRLWIKQLLQL